MDGCLTLCVKLMFPPPPPQLPPNPTQLKYLSVHILPSKYVKTSLETLKFGEDTMLMALANVEWVLVLHVCAKVTFIFDMIPHSSTPVPLLRYLRLFHPVSIAKSSSVMLKFGKDIWWVTLANMEYISALLLGAKVMSPLLMWPLPPTPPLSLQYLCIYVSPSYNMSNVHQYHWIQTRPYAIKTDSRIWKSLLSWNISVG